MTRITLLLLFFVVTATLAAPFKAACQTSIPIEDLRSILLKDWERAKAYTQEYMNAMPKNKYSFRAQDSVRTFAQQLLHISQSFNFFLAIANGQKPDFTAPDLEKRASAQSADSVMYFVNRGYDIAIEGLQKMKAADLMQNTTVTFDKPYTATRLSWLMKAFEHQTHHRGQTTIYLRLAGVKPPNEKLF